MDDMAAVDPLEREARDEVKRLRGLDDDRDLRALLSSELGRRFLGVLIYDVCGVQRLSLTGDLSSTAANEGARNVGLQMLARIESTDFPAGLTILQEREAERHLMRSHYDRMVGASSQATLGGFSHGGPLDDRA